MPASVVNRDAIPYVDSVYNNFEGEPGIGDMAQKYDFKSKFYLYYIRNYAKAMQYADSSLFLLKPHYNSKRYNLNYSLAYLRKGDILYQQKYYSSAYQWYYEGKNLMRAQDSCSYNKYMTNFNSSLAMVSYDQAKYKQAIKFWHETLNKMTCDNSFDGFYHKQGVYDDIGLCYRNLHRPDNAIVYFDKAIAFIKSKETAYPNKHTFLQIALGLVYGNKGDAYLQKQMYTQAAQCYKVSININSQKNYLAGDARLSRLKLASLYIKTSRFNEAKLQLDTLKPILDTRYRPEMLRWLQTNAAYYKNAPGGDASMAYDYLSKYVTLKDSVQTEQRILASANFSNEFNVMQQQNNFKTEVKNSRFNNILIYSTVLLVVLISAVTGSVLIRNGGLSQRGDKNKADTHQEKEVYLNWYDEL